MRDPVSAPPCPLGRAFGGAMLAVLIASGHAPQLAAQLTDPPAHPDADPPPPREAPAGMVWVPGGEFTMGGVGPSSRPDELPRHRVRVSGFWIDATEVTNARFRAFVDATGYVTTAERPIDWETFRQQLPPGTPRPPEEYLAAGSVVFAPPPEHVPLNNFLAWWRFEAGVDWRHPTGPGSDLDGLGDHPVIHVSWEDAQAYAKWAGKQLPTEAQWEFAARGGIEDAAYAWGDTFMPDGRHLANTFQGRFPEGGNAQDGFATTAPVKSFPPNGYGLYDMIGNVWEWTADWYRPNTYADRAALDAIQNDPAGPAAGLDPSEPHNPKRVIRGGSFLCHDSYCASYRPSARMRNAPNDSSGHTGFRCVLAPPPPEKMKDR